MILQQILEATESRLATLPALDAVRHSAANAPPPRDFERALAGPGLDVIAEIKRRSPSAGDIAASLDPVQLARSYQAGGASAVSVLTEPDYFGGSLDDLRAVRASIELPVLRKDFIIDERQVWESRTAGADAILLIVAAVADRLPDLLAAASAAGLATLVEAHTADEASFAVAAGATIVGVNNRDLTTFVTDLAVAERVAPALPDSTVRVAESGVSSVDGAARMAAAGYDAILVGEALVRAADPIGMLQALRGAA